MEFSKEAIERGMDQGCWAVSREMLQGVSVFVTAYSRDVQAEVKNIRGMVFWS